MIKKLFDKIKKYIKENQSFIIFLLIFIITFNINTGYSIYRPGGSINITERINKSNNLKSNVGSFNMAYVGMLEGKLPFYLLAKMIPKWEIVSNDEILYNEDENIEDSLKRDHLYYEESISNAKIIAYNKSNTPYEIKSIDNYVIYIDKRATGDIKIGDKIISYDNINFTDISNLKEYIQTKKENDIIKLKIIRDGKEITLSPKIFKEKDTLLIGIATLTINNITSKNNIIINTKTKESGPSGGLILSLAIYDALTEGNLTKGNKIVGTGAINKEGEVLEIGGIPHKLRGAVKDKADLFIVPTDNLEEALNIAKKENYDIIIKGASNFDEALEIISNLEEKQ